MSPTLALESLAFQFYVTLAVSMLVVAGAVLVVLKWGLRKPVDHAWRAYRGWLLIVPILLACYFLGREVVIAFLTAIAILGFNEFARATPLKVDTPTKWVVRLAILATGLATLANEYA